MQVDQGIALVMSVGIHAICMAALILVNTSSTPESDQISVLSVRLVQPQGPETLVKSSAPALSKPTRLPPANKPKAMPKLSQPPMPVASTPTRLDDVSLQGGTADVGETADGGGGTSDAAGATGGGDGTSWDQGPSVASYVQPEYPLRLRGQELEGDVILAIVIDETGVPSKVEVVGPSSFEEFNSAAIRALEQTRFVPAMRGGKPMITQIRFTVRFRLQD